MECKGGEVGRVTGEPETENRGVGGGARFLCLHSLFSILYSLSPLRCALFAAPWPGFRQESLQSVVGTGQDQHVTGPDNLTRAGGDNDLVAAPDKESGY